MYFKLKSNVLFRNYGDYGYITDDRNYRYVEDEVIGERIVSESGAVFLSTLNKTPKSTLDICTELLDKFKDVSIEIIRDDVEEFFSELVCDGFLCKGETSAECNSNDYVFTYKDINSKVKIDISKDDTYNTNEFLEKHESEVNRLTSVHIEITSKCNERCIHCYIPHEKKIKTLDTKNIYALLKQCKDMNVLHITLSGGEPMLHKDFCDILKQCREYDFAVSVLTNLTLLTDEIVTEMKLNGLLGVQTSLYSTDPVIHDSITKMTGSFKKTKSSILKLVENDIPLQISCPVMKQNKNCYHDVIEWAKTYGVAVSYDYALIAEYDHSNKIICNRLSLNEVSKIIKDKHSDDKAYLDKLKDDLVNKSHVDPEDPICSICSVSVCIAENGNVYPCAGWQYCVLGNILETSLNDVWLFSRKINLLRMIKNKDFPECMQCDLKGICSMCMVRNANEDCNGDYLNINEYFCNITKMKKELLN
ncbi:radical SAM protein [Citrobacter sp. CtB7.12]|uniref:Antilisterial bacteriocin subtilosin biosynthesis protein AlbA n=1 Tax=Citrobacter amalonaticus TaxID=35703 RepID=A0A6N2XJK4_CITAM|nr:MULTISPECIES: PqqD family peptide modification chaperone [Citrobacter]MBJ9865024.1 radical SAM protein [Citrobacter amalonaticus]MDU7774577.1 radical SAM protein [Citrobacter sp.]UYF55021.1 radical SAM protein [Citrobacter amalonaticus]